MFILAVAAAHLALPKPPPFRDLAPGAVMGKEGLVVVSGCGGPVVEGRGLYSDIPGSGWEALGCCVSYLFPLEYVFTEFIQKRSEI